MLYAAKTNRLSLTFEQNSGCRRNTYVGLYFSSFRWSLQTLM